jgi:dihydroxyacetone kinase
MELARHAPSTAGTLIATALIAASRVVPEGGGGGALLAAALEAGRQSIEQRGRAQPGDKTMLDALVPAIDALRDLPEASMAQALAAAADGAAAGAEATRDLEPRVGRGAWLADRSRGNVDAGAHLVAFALRAAADRAR